MTPSDLANPRILKLACAIRRRPHWADHARMNVIPFTISAKNCDISRERTVARLESFHLGWRPAAADSPADGAFLRRLFDCLSRTSVGRGMRMGYPRRSR